MSKNKVTTDGKSRQFEQIVIPPQPFCPYCEKRMVDYDDRNATDYPKFFRKKKVGYHIGCCNPDCAIQPSYFIRAVRAV